MSYVQRKNLSNFKTDNVDSFLGIGKKAKARRAERVEIRNLKKRSKIEDRSYKKRAKADALAKRYSGKAEAAIIAAQGEAEANKILAQQGVVGNPVQQQPDILSKAVDTVGQVFGGQQPGAYSEDQGEQLKDSSIGLTKAEDYKQDTQPQTTKSNTMLYIIIAAVAVAAFFILKKK